MGLDWASIDNGGVFREDTVYILQTSDGVNIWVRARGIGHNVHHTFETGDARYAWLNGVIGYAAGGRSDAGATLDVWQARIAFLVELIRALLTSL